MGRTFVCEEVQSLIDTVICVGVCWRRGTIPSKQLVAFLEPVCTVCAPRDKILKLAFKANAVTNHCLGTSFSQIYVNVENY